MSKNANLTSEKVPSWNDIITIFLVQIDIKNIFLKSTFESITIFISSRKLMQRTLASFIFWNGTNEISTIHTNVVSVSLFDYYARSRYLSR